MLDMLNEMNKYVIKGYLKRIKEYKKEESIYFNSFDIKERAKRKLKEMEYHRLAGYLRALEINGIITYEQQLAIEEIAKKRAFGRK